MTDNPETTRRRLAEAKAKLELHPDDQELAAHVRRLGHALACLEWLAEVRRLGHRGRRAINAWSRRN